jgi:hypothetical protein
MKKLVLLIFIGFSQLLNAQNSRKIVRPFFTFGDIYCNTDFGYQLNSNIQSQNTIADLRRNIGNSGILWSALDLGFNVFGPHHVLFGIDINSNTSSDNILYEYYKVKFPNQTIITSSSTYYSPVSLVYFGYGCHKTFKKITILPFVNLGIKSFKLPHDKYILSNDLDNSINSVFLDYADSILRNTESIDLMQLGLNSRIYWNGKLTNNPLKLYAEFGCNYSSKNMDIIFVEREELTGITDTKIYDYVAANINATFKIGATLRLLRLKK